LSKLGKPNKGKIEEEKEGRAMLTTSTATFVFELVTIFIVPNNLQAILSAIPKICISYRKNEGLAVHVFIIKDTDDPRKGSVSGHFGSGSG